MRRILLIGALAVLGTVLGVLTFYHGIPTVHQAAMHYFG